MAFLEIKNLFFAYGGKNAPWVLENFNLSMQKGEVLGIAGPSGQGKSTLLRIIAGLERIQKGTICLDGRVMSDAQTSVNPEDRQVGMVFQDYGLFPHMSVADNIAYGLYHLSRKERRKCVRTMLELVRMEELSKRYPYEISGGQQQRVALARSLAPKPKVLLLDEPFSSLDAELKIGIRSEVKEILDATHTTSIFVSHDNADLEAVCDRIRVMPADFYSV
ncbi:MAG: ABC transporter ATP-binding protein [Campylobacteraceae bacterium]|jgi:iron(III) transport system ATP-binding protein|nr:ABC transporter ATP-binding protein [Campylobacteraceae bacterium]